MLQETMGMEEISLGDLDCVEGMELLSLDANGMLGGFIIVWTNSMSLLNSSIIFLGIYIEFQALELGKVFSMVNLYGPNCVRIPFWENLFHEEFLKNKNIILNGDINLTIKRDKLWVTITKTMH
jgi:hypothetical protein